MYQSQSNKEEYILLSQASEKTTIPYGTLYYRAVKSKSRFFTFSGRRYLEKNCAIDLVRSIKPSRSNGEQIAIDRYLETLL